MLVPIHYVGIINTDYNFQKDLKLQYILHTHMYEKFCH